MAPYRSDGVPDTVGFPSNAAIDGMKGPVCGPIF